MSRYLLNGEPLRVTLGALLARKIFLIGESETERAMTLRPGQSVELAVDVLERIEDDPGDDECPTCEGRGSVSDGTPFRLRCETCGGTGAVTASRECLEVRHA